MCRGHDNGANYRSHQLALVCAKLGIALIHARAYQPQGKGKIERWFRSLRAQLLTRLTSQDTHSLKALNRRLWAWVEGEYHHTPHRTLARETPLERWTKQATEEHRYALGGAIDAIEHEAMEVNIEIDGCSETLDQGDRAGGGFGPFESCLFDQNVDITRWITCNVGASR